MDVTVRPHVDADLSAMVLGTRDPRIAGWITSDEAALGDAAILGAHLSRPDVRAFAIEAEGRYVGWASLEGIDATRCEATVRIIITDPDVWGCGVGSAAGNFLLDVARRMGLGRLRAELDPANHRACALAESLGFDPIPDSAGPDCIGLTLDLRSLVAA